MEHGAIRAPKLDAPVADSFRADDGAAVRTVTSARVGLDAKLHGPVHALAVIPMVLNRGGSRGLELRVEEHGAWRNLAARCLASPGLESGAELRRSHRWRHRRSCGYVGPGADRVVPPRLGSSRLNGRHGVLRLRQWLGRRRR